MKSVQELLIEKEYKVEYIVNIYTVISDIQKKEINLTAKERERMTLKFRSSP